MTIDRDKEFDAITPQEIFEEARDRQRIWDSAESENCTRAKEDLLFAEGNQWPPDRGRVLEEESPRIVINLTEAMVRRVVNNLTDQRARGKADPVGDSADVQTAEAFTGIGRHIEVRSTSVPYDNGAESAVKIGFGYWRVLIEYVNAKSFTQDVRIAPIHNAFSVAMDPMAMDPTGSDAGWVVLFMDMKRTEFRRRYPKAENSQWAASEDIDRGGWESEESIRLAEYFRVREMPDTLLEVQGPDGTVRKILESEEDPAEGEKVLRDRPTTRRQIEWFRLNGTAVVERAILPGTWIPIIRVEGNATNIDGKVYRKGMVRPLIDPQRMVNYGESAKVQRLGLAPKSPWIAAVGQVEGHPEWETSNREPHAVLTYDPITVTTDQGETLLPPPQRTPAPQIEAGFSELTQAMRTNLLAVAGMPMEPGADTQGTIVSGRAIQRRDKLSDQSHSQYARKLKLSIQHTWRIILEYVRATYTDSEARRAIGDDGTPKMLQVNKPMEQDGVTRILNDMSVGDFDIVMNDGPGYETRREEGADALLQLLQSAPLAQLIAQHGADLVFRSIDHPYMQELADRLQALTPQGMEKVMEQLPERARSFIRALAQQLQQVQQALQQAQLENKYHLASKQLDAQVKSHDTAVNAETRRIDTQVKARTALAVEEIKAGASLLNTHVEAEHHQREAERMIQQAHTAESPQ